MSDELDDNLERSLTSARDLIDRWVICDTTSSRRTSRVIRKALRRIPGELHRSAWVDFGHNRSELMSLARNKADYLLLLDTNLTIQSGSPLSALSEDVYVLKEAGGREHDLPRLVRGSRRWWYEGSTHEVLATEGRYTVGTLDTIVLERSGSEPSDRRGLLRRLGILEREAEGEAPTSRTCFLLAETLRELGQAQEALEWYRRRLAFKDSNQETFYARLQEGVLKATTDFSTAVPVLLDAWERRPTRAEPLYELARGYRELGVARLAYLFSNLGLQLPETTDTLFLERWIYDWGLRFERGCAAGRLGNVEEATADLLSVVESGDLPASFAETAEGWLDSFANQADNQSIKSATVPLYSLVDDLQSGRIAMDITPDWPTFNPSIAADNDGFLVAGRSANIVGYQDGTVLYNGLPRRNMNYLVKLDANLSLIAIDQLDETAVEFPRHRANSVGLQDLRMIEVGGKWFGIGNSWELSPSRGAQSALVEFEDGAISRVQRLVGPDPDRVEKNWMPFVHDGELHLVYSCGPMIVLRYDRNTRDLTIVAENKSPELASAFRGGSQGIPLDTDGYLFVVHETDHNVQTKVRKYAHRFIRVDRDLRLNAASPPFTFGDETREFCAGAAVHGEELVVSFGRRHTEAWLATLPLADAIKLLEPIGAER